MATAPMVTAPQTREAELALGQMLGNITRPLNDR
jgi:hypothetical protein